MDYLYILTLLHEPFNKTVALVRSNGRRRSSPRESQPHRKCRFRCTKMLVAVSRTRTRACPRTFLKARKRIAASQRLLESPIVIERLREQWPSPSHPPAYFYFPEYYHVVIRMPGTCQEHRHSSPGFHFPQNTPSDWRAVPRRTVGKSSDVILCGDGGWPLSC